MLRDGKESGRSKAIQRALDKRGAAGKKQGTTMFGPPGPRYGPPGPKAKNPFH